MCGGVLLSGRGQELRALNNLRQQVLGSGKLQLL
jgi:hypothetical protein